MNAICKMTTILSPPQCVKFPKQYPIGIAYIGHDAYLCRQKLDVNSECLVLQIRQNIANITLA